MTGDGWPITTTEMAEETEVLLLHEAIARRDGHGSTASAHTSFPPPASAQQISKTADVFVDWLLDDAAKLLEVDKQTTYWESKQFDI